MSQPIVLTNGQHEIKICTPAEPGTMFAAVAARRPELLPWLACAASTGARVSEIDHHAWANISCSSGADLARFQDDRFQGVFSNWAVPA